MPAPELVVYGSEISYFTGKLEAYLRFKEIPYERRPMTMRLFRGVVPEKTGAAQMPAVELPDGRWMTDTTPIIAWLETQHPEPAVIPEDPLQAFFSRLLEDHADEWLCPPSARPPRSCTAGRHRHSARRPPRTRPNHACRRSAGITAVPGWRLRSQALIGAAPVVPPPAGRTSMPYW